MRGCILAYAERALAGGFAVVGVRSGGSRQGGWLVLEAYASALRSASVPASLLLVPTYPRPASPNQFSLLLLCVSLIASFALAPAALTGVAVTDTVTLASV